MLVYGAVMMLVMLASMLLLLIGHVHAAQTPDCSNKLAQAHVIAEASFSSSWTTIVPADFDLDGSHASRTAAQMYDWGHTWRTNLICLRDSC